MRSATRWRRRCARRDAPNAKGMTQKDVVLDNLDDVIADVSGEEGYRFNARQLFYVLRPIVMDETGEELKIDNFTEHHRPTTRTSTAKSR